MAKKQKKESVKESILMKLPDIKKVDKWIFYITILYIIIFAIYFFSKGNSEFLIYIFVMVVLTTILTYLHLKFRFPSILLAGASIWGLMHMAGGSVYLFGTRLYDFMLLNIVGAPHYILKYDQFVHFYCYVIMTPLLFYILKPHLKQGYNKFIVTVLVIIMGIGVGATNEIIEFMPVLFELSNGVGDLYNTSWDLIFNTLGAILSMIIVYYKVMKKE